MRSSLILLFSLVDSVSQKNYIYNLNKLNGGKKQFPAPYTKINSKWIKDLNVRPDSIKLLEENRGQTLLNVNHSSIFFDPPPRIMKIFKIKK